MSVEPTLIGFVVNDVTAVGYVLTEAAQPPVLLVGYVHEEELLDGEIYDPPAAVSGDHGALTGLADDDHPQYHNDTRGDARYQQLEAGKGLSTNDYSTAEKSKLAGIAAGATANDTDANLKDRANHTGAQAISTVTGLQAELDAKMLSAHDIAKTKTADQTTTLDSLVDVADMEFNIPANETWIFESNLFNGCNGTGGLRYAIDVPAGASFMGQADGTTSGHNVRGGCRITTDDSDPLAPSFNTVVSAGGFTKIWGTVVNGATPGAVKIRYKSATAGQTSTVYRHSIMWARKVS